MEAPSKAAARGGGVAVALKDFSVDVVQKSLADLLPSATPAPPVTLLQPLTAYIAGGEMFGILGGSGSGKTTLLNVIAGRYDRQSYLTHGTLSFVREGLTSQGVAASVVDRSSCSVAYVTQDDFLHPYLTVRETLQYAAQLKISASGQSAATGPGPRRAEQAVTEVILELGLKECADSLIGTDDGTSRRGISGGEKRRVSIALQILTHPVVLAADEPSSGLDSFTAITVMECLQRLTQHGTTVICSIHQPRSDIFALFHSVLLLSAGGQPVYGGPVSRILSYFSALGYACPEHANPADYFIDLTAVDHSSEDKRLASTQRVHKLLAAFAAAHLRDQTETELSSSSVVIKSPTPAVAWSTQVGILARRLLRCKRRDKSHLLGALVQASIEGLVVMAIFWQLPLSTAGISSRSGLAYVTVSVQYYLLMIVLIDQYCAELRGLVDRELQDGAYHPTAYYAAHWLVSWPVLLAQSVVYSTLIYAGCGLRPGGSHYMMFLAVNFALSILINAMVWVCVTLQRDFSVASLIGNFNFTFLSLTAGFLVNLDAMPAYVRWVKNISFLSYAYRMLMSNEFSHRGLDLDEGYTVQGDDVLSAYGVAVDDYTVPWAVMFVIATIYVCVGLTLITVVRFPPTGAAGGSIAHADEAPGQEEGTARGSLTYSALATDELLAEDDDQMLPLDLPVDLAEDAAPTDPVPQPSDSGVKDLSGVRIDVRVTSLEVQGRKSRKCILRNVHATMLPGRLVAIMGGSGSGKTTLLNLLANRVPQASLGLAKDPSVSSSAAGSGLYSGRGEVLFDGRPFTAAQLRRTVGYVQQFDFHLPSLTVLETLQFHARLRLSALTAAACMRRVHEVASLLNLRSCLHVCVGDGSHKGVSGGEKRRLSIAVQLLSSPLVLLLDEVTTGLDAYTARRVVLLLRSLARKPYVPGESQGQGGKAKVFRTIVLSIHQPRYDIFACFDDVLLLSRGQVIWSGNRHAMATHFHKLGQPFPALCNPADFVLDISSIDFRSDEREDRSRALVANLVSAYTAVSAGASVSPPFASSPSTLAASVSPTESLTVPMARALPLLVGRSFTNLRRQPHLLLNCVSQGWFYVLILAAFYAPLGDDQSGVQNRIGCLYELTALCFVGMLALIAKYPQERDVFYREYPDGYYSAWSHALSYFVVSTPLLVLTAVGIALLIASTGLVTSAKEIAQTSAIVFAFMFVGECIGVAFCSAFRQIGFSVNVMSAVVSFLGIMAGYISLDMPALLDYLAMCSPFKWGAFIMTNLAFRGKSFSCTADDATCYSTGEEVLEAYDMQGSMVPESYLLLGVTGAYLVAAFVAVRLRAKALSH